MSQIPALAKKTKTEQVVADVAGGADVTKQMARKRRRSTSALQDLGLLLLRVFQGGLLAGHGSQKLFGMYGGYGLDGTAGWLESMNLKPGKTWAVAAGAGELGGGLVALGLWHPLGEIATISAMAMAIAKGHWGKPIWATAGGPELPIVNMAVSTALIFTGPGRFSLDRIFGNKVPAWVTVLTALGAAGTVAYGINISKPVQLASANEQGPVDANRA